MPVDTHKPAFDRDAAMARVGGDAELLKELAELFEEEWPRSLTLLREAVERGDPAAVQNAAHGLKGAVANFGARPAVDAASELEKLAREARLAEAPQALAALEEALASLQTELAAL
jgi:HPt (histidine-containing phosphotransfer) domain-containing protein